MAQKNNKKPEKADKTKKTEEVSMQKPGSISEKNPIAKREEEILAFWQKNKIFEKSLEKDSPKGEFVFYDGPPFANGPMHYGHILAGVLKDAIPRYKTMQGFHVGRRWGWDCHGLPVENYVEKELGLKSKIDIEKYGIGKFSEVASKSVLKHTDEWKKMVPRLGRFVDMENDYRTMDKTFTESVWWVFKTLFDKGLIYEDFKSMHLCPRCGTTLSNFEVNQGYKDITDISVYVKFELVDEPETYLLAWTTTPWTLPGNAALAVKSEIPYVKIEVEGQKLILAKSRLSAIKKEYKILSEISGSELVGKSYKPLFDYYSKKPDLKNRENGWKVYDASFVTTEDGTGIVHIAPAFGEDDLNLGRENKFPFIQHVSPDGMFKKEVTDFAGQYVKPKDDHQKADIEVIKYLAHKGLLFEKEKIIHPYPHCWRCDTPLLNYAASSWFVKVTDLKDKLVSENKKIRWVPEDIRDGRFGKWLEGARDWAISRTRYWGAPLPVWKCHKCNSIKVAGSISDLREFSKPNNSYLIVRHGEAEQNVKGILNGKDQNKYHLTEKGKTQAKETGSKLSKENIDFIVTSPFLRTLETAEEIAKVINLPKDKIIVDENLRELNTGSFDGGPIGAYHSFEKGRNMFKVSPDGGENYSEVSRRVIQVVLDLEEKYKDKKIVLVTHECPAWLLYSAAQGISEKETDLLWGNDGFITNAEVKKLDYRPLPRNQQNDLDLHRPYIDSVKLHCECGEEVKRIPEVFDCWFESGSMPYGSNHYPFENKDKFDPNPGWLRKPKGFPADFIAEGLDQTRGWFYSMLVLSVGLFGKASYKNVIVNGIILAENGEKMSKRLRNYPDPIDVINKYGTDALRYYLLSSPVVAAQDSCFSEKGVDEVMKKMVARLNNVYSFYELYKSALQSVTDVCPDSENILDKWIIARLNATVSSTTKAMDKYELDRAVRPLNDFIEDLSTWYIRRSRDRFKGDNQYDKRNALLTTRFVLKELSKVMAPFMPFLAEDIYQKVKTANDLESVHLESWPETKVSEAEEKLIKEMSETRKMVSLGLEARAKSGIKVRQPLSKLRVKNIKSKVSEEFLGLVRDEVNVKDVVFVADIKEEVEVDTNITQDLKEEGWVREFVRNIQDIRKEMKFNPSDVVALTIECLDFDRALIEKYNVGIKKTAVIRSIKFDKVLEGKIVKTDSSEMNISILK